MLLAILTTLQGNPPCPPLIRTPHSPRMFCLPLPEDAAREYQRCWQIDFGSFAGYPEVWIGSISLFILIGFFFDIPVDKDCMTPACTRAAGHRDFCECRNQKRTRRLPGPILFMAV